MRWCLRTRQLHFLLALSIRAHFQFAMLAFVNCWGDNVRRQMWNCYALDRATIRQRLVHWGGYCRQIDAAYFVRLMLHILSVAVLWSFFGLSLSLKQPVSTLSACVFGGGYDLNGRVKRIWG